MGARQTVPGPYRGICDGGCEEGGVQDSVAGAAVSRRLASLLVAVELLVVWYGGFSFVMGRELVLC